MNALCQKTRVGTTPSGVVTPGLSSGASILSSARKHGLSLSQGGPPAKRARVTPPCAQDKSSRLASHSRNVNPTPSHNGRVISSASDSVLRAPLRVSAQTNGIAPPLPPPHPNMKGKINGVSLPIPGTTPKFGYPSTIGLGTAPLRLPSGTSGYAQSDRYASGPIVRSVSGSSISGGSRPRSAMVARATAKVAKRRDSFKPRPSVDYTSIDVSGINGVSFSAGGERTLKEESDEELEL